jgi:hypothetical protein
MFQQSQKPNQRSEAKEGEEVHKASNIKSKRRSRQCSCRGFAEQSRVSILSGAGVKPTDGDYEFHYVGHLFTQMDSKVED